MKKLFIIGAFLWIQFLGIASPIESEYKILSKTHKPEIDSATGDTIYYPKEYADYKEFKEKFLEEKYITELLTTRLSLLRGIYKSFVKTPEEESIFLHHKGLLDSNQITLMANARSEDLTIEFPEINNLNTTIEHSKEVASLLKKRLEARIEKQDPEEEQITREITELSQLIEFLITRAGSMSIDTSASSGDLREKDSTSTPPVGTQTSSILEENTKFIKVIRSNQGSFEDITHIFEHHFRPVSDHGIENALKHATEALQDISVVIIKRPVLRSIKDFLEDQRG